MRKLDDDAYTNGVILYCQVLNKFKVRLRHDYFNILFLPLYNIQMGKFL